MLTILLVALQISSVISPLTLSQVSLSLKSASSIAQVCPQAAWRQVAIILTRRQISGYNPRVGGQRFVRILAELRRVLEAVLRVCGSLSVCGVISEGRNPPVPHLCDDV